MSNELPGASEKHRDEAVELVRTLTGRHVLACFDEALDVEQVAAFAARVEESARRAGLVIAAAILEQDAHAHRKQFECDGANCEWYGCGSLLAFAHQIRALASEPQAKPTEDA